MDQPILLGNEWVFPTGERVPHVSGGALADVSDILKHDYHGPLRTTLNNSVALDAQIERRTDSITGDFAVIPMEIGREIGVGGRKEREPVPAGGSIPPKVCHVKVKRLYGVFTVTKAEIAAMDTDRGSFERAITRRMRNLKDAITRWKSQQAWNDGSGRVAHCGTTTASATVVLDAATSEQVLTNLAEGMRIDIGTDANPQLIASDRTVVSVDFDNATVDISGAVVTTSASHFLYRQGSGGDPGTDDQREITGLGLALDNSADLQELGADDAFGWSATVDENGGDLRPVSENLIERAVHRHQNRSGATVDSLWAEDAVFRACVNSLRGRTRQINTRQLKGGYEAIDFQVGAENLPLMRDRDATANQIVGIQDDAFADFVQIDWDWEDENGSGQVLRLTPDRVHEYEAWFYSFRERGYYERNKFLLIDDVEGA